MGSETRTCVAALRLGEEGVNGTHGGSKDVGRREAKGRASQRKHLRERRYSPAWWLFLDLGHNCVREGGDPVGVLGRREDQSGRHSLSISPMESWGPRQIVPHRSPGVRPHLSGGDRSRGGGEGAGEWGAAEAGQGRGPWGPQQAGGEGGAADSSQHSATATVGDGVLITGVDAYRQKDTEGSLVPTPPCASSTRCLGQPLPRENTPPGLATHTSLRLLLQRCHICL